MAVIGIKDLVTGNTLYTSMGASGKGWVSKEIKEERT